MLRVNVVPFFLTTSVISHVCRPHRRFHLPPTRTDIGRDTDTAGADLVRTSRLSGFSHACDTLVFALLTLLLTVALLLAVACTCAPSNVIGRNLPIVARQFWEMQTISIPDGFESIPTYDQSEDIHTHPALKKNGILAFRHKATRVRIVQFATPGPLVSATIVVGTKPLSNAGHPHTLEHIIFLGSHHHPRGYLDNLACRCLADGTNAWTDDDYTAYTTVTAGFDGFAHILPAFLDHILRPRINEAAFASEVYHVRADGKEAGVVFCEMQARENTEGDLSQCALAQALLSNTPLQYMSGGLCKDIRHLTNEDIARFHYDQYCAANVSVVVGGMVDSFALLSSVKSLLDEVAAAPGFTPGKLSWDSPLTLPPLPMETRKLVPFPCPDQDIGSIIIGWRGPGCFERKRNMAIDILLRYLSYDVWSPLRQEFVETEDQLASDIYYSQDVFLDVSVVSLTFPGVRHLEGEEDADAEEESAKESDMDDDEDVSEDDDDSPQGQDGDESESLLTSGKLEQMVIGRLAELAKSGTLPGGIAAVRRALKKERETQLADMESSSHDVIPHELIEELVYGNCRDLTIGEETRGFLEKYEALEREDESFWISLLKDNFVHTPHVEIVMVPDARLATTLAEEENNSVAERIRKVGKEELERIGKENEARVESLKAGKFESAAFPPMPNTVNISRWPYSVVRDSSPEYAMQSVALETEFVHCTIFLDTSSMPAPQRVLLPILCELVPSCDIRLADGSSIPYTEHSKALSDATISTDYAGIFLGYGSDLAHQCVVIHYAASPDSFEEATRLTLQSLFEAEITAERVSVVAQTLLANSTSDMRDGYPVLLASVALLPYFASRGNWDRETPNFVLGNFLGLFPLLSFLSEEFTRKKARKNIQRRVIQKLHDCLHAVRSLSESKVFVQVAARDPKPANEIVKALWSQKHAAFESGKFNGTTREPDGEERLAITRRLCSRYSELIAGGTVGKIIGIHGVESSCLDVRVDSPVHNGHGEWSALTVLTEMLSRMEGPLSNAVRGEGLAYHVEISNSRWRGQLIAKISESASPAAAWDALCKTLKEFREKLDSPTEYGLDVELETTKAASLFSLNRSRSTPESIAMGAIRRTALGAPASPLADRAQEEAIENVRIDRLAETFDKYVVKLLEPANRLAVVTCGQGILEETIQAFQNCEHALQLTECSLDSLKIPHVVDVVRDLKEPC